MQKEEFEKIFENRINLIKKMLADQAAEGGSEYIFDRTSQIDKARLAKIYWDDAAKTLNAVAKLFDKGPDTTTANIEEKIGDLINYLILLEVILKS